MVNLLKLNGWKNKMVYGRFPDFNTFLIIGLIVAFVLFNLPSFERDTEVEAFKVYIDNCQREHENLLEIKEELNEIKSIDIQRAYKECREDLESAREKPPFMAFMFFIGGVMGMLLTWHFTRMHFENKYILKLRK